MKHVSVCDMEPEVADQEPARRQEKSKQSEVQRLAKL
jgi:hypothetical protein